MGITSNATTPKKGKSATVHSFEFARAYSTLKKTPDHRKQKCRELLHEQIFLESRLRTVRSMLDAVTNTDRPVRTKGALVAQIGQPRKRAGAGLSRAKGRGREVVTHNPAPDHQQSTKD